MTEPRYRPILLSCAVLAITIFLLLSLLAVALAGFLLFPVQ